MALSLAPFAPRLSSDGPGVAVGAKAQGPTLCSAGLVSFSPGRFGEGHLGDLRAHQIKNHGPSYLGEQDFKKILGALPAGYIFDRVRRFVGIGIVIHEAISRESHCMVHLVCHRSTSYQSLHCKDTPYGYSCQAF